MTHRVVFLGSPDFAVPSLRALVEDDRFEVALVVSQPDRRAGRGRKLTPPPVAAFAAAERLPLFQPHTLQDEDAVHRLSEARPDLLIVVAYGEILTRRVLSIAPLGALNVHPSLLPKYRGASPIPAAILSGDPVTGVSIMKLVRRLDSGPVLAAYTVPIEFDATTGSLGTQLSHLAARSLPDVAAEWIDGDINAVEQDDDEATYTREWTKSDAHIDWDQPAAHIERLVRAALPWPVAWSTIDGSRVQVRWSRLPEENVALQGNPGSVTERSGTILVSTGGGLLELVTVQPESKRPMPAAEWWRSAGSQDLTFE